MTRPENMKLRGGELNSSVSRDEANQRMVNIINNKHDFSSNRADLDE